MTDQLAADAAEADSGTDIPNDGTAPASARPHPWRRDRERVSRWDRPPQPRDWRFFVGNAGRALIATGLLMFGFVAYQLWGTGIETARAQNRLEAEFERLVSDRLAEPGAPSPTAAPVAPTPTTPTPTTPTLSTPTPTTPTPTTPTTPPTLTERPTGTTVVAAAPDGSAGATPVPDGGVAGELRAFGRGDPLAMLEIPAIGRRDIVVPGVRLDDLKSGPGHYPDTPLPGQLGNAAIAGHRTTYGAPFFDVDQLEPGDELIVTMVTGDRFVYVVTGTEIVAATRYDVVATTDPDVAQLTLTSCHPKYTARDRIVVRSVLDPARSSTVGPPTFYELDGTDDAAGDAIPGDDPVVSLGTDDDGRAADRDRLADGAVGDPSGREPGDPSGERVATEPAVADGRSAPPGAEPAAAGDAFALGWFHDPAAWPHIALWASVLALIALVTAWISRRTRRDSVGILVGAVPFLIALYFFYQNVNRLLPPGI